MNVEKMLKNWETNWQKIVDKDQQAKVSNKLVGRYIAESIADGKAIYQIVKENKHSVKIKWCTGLGDDYMIPYWQTEAVIKKEYVLRHIKAREGLEKLFGRGR